MNNFIKCQKFQYFHDLNSIGLKLKIERNYHSILAMKFNQIELILNYLKNHNEKANNLEPNNYLKNMGTNFKISLILMKILWIIP